MTPQQYHERARARFDMMHTREKDRIILGFIDQLYPNGDPDHPVNAADFVAEAVRLLTDFHPDHLNLPGEKTEPPEDLSVPTF